MTAISIQKINDLLVDIPNELTDDIVFYLKDISQNKDNCTIPNWQIEETERRKQIFKENPSIALNQDEFLNKFNEL